jgi:hypothetical protein
MDIRAFSSLLAQVVPVLLLALAVETRSHHRTFQNVLGKRTKPEPSSAGDGINIWPDARAEPAKFRKLLFFYLVSLYLLMGLYALIEVSALAVSVFPSPGTIAILIASPSFSIIVLGFGFAFVTILTALSTNLVYVELKVISDRDRRTLHWPLRIVGAIVILFAGLVVLQAH